MSYIKEYSEKSDICVVREDRYGSGLDKFLNLFEVAKEAFPTLEPKDITIKHYGGDRYAKTFGIEFRPTCEVPEEYDSIHQLELTR